MTVLIGFITPQNAERMLASNRTDVGAEIDHLRNGGFVGRGMRMQLTPDGFRVQVSESALAGYYIETHHLHTEPLDRGTQHFERYTRLMSSAQPMPKQEALPETVVETEELKEPRYRYRVVRKRFKTWNVEDRPYDTAPRESITVRCYTPKQGRRKVRLHREVPRKPWSPMAEWIDWRYGHMAELTEVCAHVPVDASVDFRYQPHNGFRSQRKEKGCGTRMKSDGTKAHKKALTHRETRRRLKQVIDIALRKGHIDHKVKLPRLTYQNWSM